MPSNDPFSLPETQHPNLNKEMTLTMPSVIGQKFGPMFNREDHWKIQKQLFIAEHSHTRDLAEIGHLTKSLISAKQLQKILPQIRSPLTVTFAYRNFRPYWLWTIPLFRNKRVVKTEPEVSAVAIGRQTGYVINAGRCYFKDPTVCLNTIRKQMPCAEGIAVKNPALLARCGIAQMNATLRIVVQITKFQVLLTTIEERCLDRASSMAIDPGMYLLTVTPGCTIDSDSDWSYMERDDLIYRTIENKLLLAGLKVIFSYPSFPTLPRRNWTHFGELHELFYHNLPDLKRVVKPFHMYSTCNPLSVKNVTFSSYFRGVALPIG
ncbi:hypothetical protein CAPTEDRAFT_187991 [Capitella teleta]|uniref:Uncharacterized protein n=1 Tax=Capitella teleta TaxID=283909 RepID=R7U4X0_CAPTE|nr:hypothetical protein CAPTEDRAFT_187991 [Capitella teleta]|eukprot:ELU01166.1 hypothetical protein CAPTEDRAFT_187991 [Capitella teleta]